MEKGVLCLGCSYTWGESLYFYSGLADDILKRNHGFDVYQMREVYNCYRKKYRWPRLLANELDSWEYTSDIGNGGANISHYQYCVHNQLLSGQIKYSDFNYFVWQFTDPLRDFPGGYERLETFSDDQVFDIVEEECTRQLLFIDRMCNEWEKRGVKVLTLSWWPELIEHPYYKKLFKNRDVKIYTEKSKHDSFSEIIFRGSEIVVKETEDSVWLDVTNDNGIRKTIKQKKYTIRDNYYLKGFQRNDVHFNKQGHKMLSDSILKKINEKLI